MKFYSSQSLRTDIIVYRLTVANADNHTALAMEKSKFNVHQILGCRNVKEIFVTRTGVTIQTSAKRATL